MGQNVNGMLHYALFNDILWTYFPDNGQKSQEIRESDYKRSLKCERTRTTRTPAFWDTPCQPMITHNSDSHQIPSQNKTKSKLQIKKKANNSNFTILQGTLHMTLLKLLDTMYKYGMDPTRTVGATERTWDAGRTNGPTDGPADGQTDRVKPIYPPTTSLCGKV